MGRTRDITDRAHQHYMEQRAQQQLVQRCVFCDWTVTASLAEASLLAVAHRETSHPEARQRTRFARKRGGIKTIGLKSLGENIALNRAQGASAWASKDTLEL